MSNNLFRKSKKNIVSQQNKYGVFDLKRNPFPSKPGVTLGSPNPVENGSIYLSEMRTSEQEDFDKLMIPNPTQTQSKEIAFLMDYATRSGRGIGKTAFLNHQLKRIMADHGDELTHHSEVLFAIHISPSSNNARQFWQFSKLILQTLVEQEIIAQAMWRLRAFSGLISDDTLSKVGDNPRMTIGNDQWLQGEGVDTFMALSHEVRTQLQEINIDDDLVDVLVKFGHSPDEFKKYFFNKISDFQWRKQEGRILFNDIVKVLIKAGFTKGVLLCDEMEKIIQKQNTKERREFVENLRYFFIDGLSESARMSFFSLFITIHPYSQELLNPHWKATGLDRFADLGGEFVKEYTVYFHPLNKEVAIPLAKEYLVNARVANSKLEELHPFNTDALVEGLIKTGGVPGKFLTLLYLAIERAIQEGWKEIDAKKIQDIGLSNYPEEPPTQETIKPLPTQDITLK